MKKPKKIKPKQIKYLRTSVYNLSQPDFGLVMGIGTATVSRWERNMSDPTGISFVILQAAQQAVDLHGEQRIRGVNWSRLLDESGLMVVLAGILNFAITEPEPMYEAAAPPAEDQAPIIEETPSFASPEPIDDPDPVL